MVLCDGSKILGFSVSIENNLFLCWGVEVDLIL